MFIHYLKVAYRSLVKHKMQALISIVGLGVGIACFTFCTSFLQQVYSLNNNMPHINRVCFAADADAAAPTRYRASLLGPQLKKDFAEIEATTSYIYMGGYTNRVCEVIRDNIKKPLYFEENILFVDSSFVSFYEVRLLQGSWRDILATPSSIVLTKTAAKKFYGSDNPIGKTFKQIDDFHNREFVYTVSGVIADFPDNSDFQLISGLEFNTLRPEFTDASSYDFYSESILLRKNVDIEELNKKLARYTVPGTDKHVRLIPLKQQREFYSGGKHLQIPLLFFGIGLLVLLTTFFNYLAFMFGKFFTRLKEQGIRQVNGADRRQLFYLLFTEMFCSFLLATFLATVLIEVAYPVLVEREFINPYIHRYQLFFQLFQYMLAGTGVMFVLCWIVTVKINRETVLSNLYRGGSMQRKSVARNWFLCIQLAICILFAGGTFFIQRQVRFAARQMLGTLSIEEKENIYSINLNGDKLEPVRQIILNDIRNNPYITDYHINGNSIYEGWVLRNYSWENMPADVQDSPLLFMYAGANYADFLHAKLIEGRYYRDDERKCAVVNRTLARKMGGKVIGKEIAACYLGNEYVTYRIVGVMEDIMPIGGFHTVQPACLYMPYPENYMNMEVYIKTDPVHKKQVVDGLRSKLQSYVSPATPIQINNIGDYIRFFNSSEIQLAQLTFLFSVVCLIISLLGIYSSVMLATERRKKEVAIRKINGAPVAVIIRMFCRKYFVLLTVAAVVAFPVLYLFIERWGQNFVFRAPVNMLTFIGIFLLMGVVVLLTIIFQIVKTARINPAEVVKNE